MINIVIFCLLDYGLDSIISRKLKPRDYGDKLLDRGVREIWEWGLAKGCARIGATRFTRVRSCILCAPAGPLPSRETVPVGHSIVFRWCPFASELAWTSTKKRLRLSSQPFLGLAERTRFELAVELPLRQFSKLLVSATHPPLRKLAEIYFQIASAKVLLFFICARKIIVFFAFFFFGLYWLWVLRIVFSAILFSMCCVSGDKMLWVIGNNFF